MVKKDSNRFMVGLVVLVFAILLGAASYFVLQQTAFTDLADCEFTVNESTCLYNITLPENRAASVYPLQFEFDKRASGVFGEPLIVEPVDVSDWLNEEKRDKDEFFKYFLYKLPSEVLDTDIASFKIISTTQGTAECRDAGTPKDDAEINVQHGLITIPWTNDIRIGDDADNDDGGSINYLIEYDRASDGDKYVQFKNWKRLNGAKIADCYGYETESEILELESIISSSDLQEDITKQRFFIYSEREEDYTGGSAQLNSLKVSVAIQPATYPTDVVYSIDGERIETLSGSQSTTYTTLDIANEINEACDRDKNGEECTVTITLTSSEVGAMKITPANPVLRLSDELVDEEPTDSTGNENDSGAVTGLSGMGVIIAVLVVLFVGMLVYISYIVVNKSKKKRGKK